MSIFSQKRAQYAVLFSIILLFVLSTTLIVHYITRSQSLHNKAYKQAQKETETATHQLNSFIKRLKPIVNNIVNTLNTKKLSKQEIEDLLRQKPVEIFGLGISFAPFKFSAKERLYAPYYVEKKGKNEMIYTQDEYDYTQPEHDWFNKPMTEGPQFIKAYYGKAAGTIMTGYAAPFFDPEDHETPIGIVGAEQSITHLKHILSALYPGSTGYWFIISQDGTFLAHPLNYLVNEQKTIFDLATEIDSPILQKAGTMAVENKDVFLEYNNEVTHAHSWLIGKQIPETNWSLFRVVDTKELPVKDDVLRQNLMLIVINSLILLLLILIYILLIIPLTPPILWIISSVGSLILATSIGSMWYITNLYPDYTQNLKSITSKDELYSMLEQDKITTIEQEKTQDTLSENEAEDYFTTNILEKLTYQFTSKNKVPTGILISHLQFSAQNQIDIVGYVWQHYSLDLHTDLSRGFELPQAKNSSIKEIYRTQKNNIETVLWNVQATLNQKLEYSDYPFDVKNLQIQIWHKDFDKNILLIPDFDSYKIINPKSTPGIATSASIQNWDIESSYFGYKKNNYTTLFGMYENGPFGIYQTIEKSNTPELYFDITVKRYLIDTLIADLLPLAVVFFLLFAILVTSVAQGYGILGSCAGIFFSTVFAYVRFRVKVPSDQLVYFENFYFISYAAILGIIVVSMLYLLEFNIWLIRYRENMIAQLLYWPIILGAINIITVFYLY